MELHNFLFLFELLKHVTSLCISIYMIVLLIRSAWRGTIETRAFLAWIEAGEVFFAWRLRNPGVYIGLSHEGRRLLTELIAAYDRFLELNPELKDNGHRDYYLSLYNHLPPKRPTSKRPPKGRFLFFNAMKYLPTHCSQQPNRSSSKAEASSRPKGAEYGACLQ